MSEKLKAPKITNYISYLGRIGYRNIDCSFSYDEKTYLIIDKLFEILKQIEPISKNGARKLWLRAERGTLEDFGNVDEMIEEGEVENREELERWWLDEFPDETVWYNFTAVEDEEIGYRMILLGNKFIIEVDHRRQKDYPHDISDLAEWLLDSVKECISQLKDGTYNTIVETGLPPQHRTGTIERRHLWDVFPEARKSFFKDISKADVEDFIALARAQDNEIENTKGRLKTVTTNDFYSFCALGYKANNYKGCDLSPKEQYYLHADGRDDGLGEIEADSPETFSEYLITHGITPFSESVQPYLDYQIIGAEFYADHDGAFCRAGYVVRKEELPEQFLQTEQEQESVMVLRLRAFRGKQQNPISTTLVLPAADELLERTRQRLGIEEFAEAEITMVDYIFPYFATMVPQDCITVESANALAQAIEQMNQTDGELLKYLAAVELEQPDTFDSVLQIARNIDNYEMIPTSQADDGFHTQFGQIRRLDEPVEMQDISGMELC